ncbi:hypothetical protein Ancab_017111 [Ancistrocladus abbreviatus]
MIKENPNIGTFDGRSLSARQQMVIAETPRLGKEVALKALKERGQPKSKLTHLIFCSTVGVDMPGCFASGTILRIAKDVVENKKGARLLVFYITHPSGRAILDGVEKKLGLDKDKMKESRYVLSEYGNLTGACVLFILDEMRKRFVEEGRSTTGKGCDYGVLLGFRRGIYN